MRWNVTFPPLLLVVLSTMPTLIACERKLEAAEGSTHQNGSVVNEPLSSKSPITPYVSSCRHPSDADRWWTYLADYDGLPGSTLLNMSLKDHAPLEEYPIVLIAGHDYAPSPGGQGLPDPEELQAMNEVAEQLEAAISKHTPCVAVGVFTHKGERLSYIYVANSDGLEALVKDHYERVLQGRASYINIRPDPEWRGYLDFLYPNETILRHYRIVR